MMSKTVHTEIMTVDEYRSDIDANVDHLIAHSGTTDAIESVAPHFSPKLEAHISHYQTTILRSLCRKDSLVRLEALLTEGKFPKSFAVIKKPINTKGTDL